MSAEISTANVAVPVDPARAGSRRIGVNDADIDPVGQNRRKGPDSDSVSDPVPIQGIVLLGGGGSRMRPVTSGNKHLLSVAGRPMADYGLELLVRCGISSITVVMRPEDDRQFQNRFARSVWGQYIDHVVHQPSPAGTADALARCRAVIDSPRVATLWGDNLFEQAPVAMVGEFLTSSKLCTLAVTDTETPHHFGNVIIDGDQVTAFIDKPQRPVSPTVTTGFMLFDSAALLEAVVDVPVDARGEQDAMHAVRRFVSCGGARSHRITGAWFDAGVSPEFLRATRLFAIRRGFNHLPNTAEEVSWTCATRPHLSASTSTPPAAAN